jgi:alpha-1,3-rhamnosyl/mannosyltransferase
LAPLVIDIERRIRELELSDDVRLLGFVSQTDLPMIYAGAMMFIYPSLYEGFGMPVLEAMCQRVPVVCSNTSSLPEVGGLPRDHQLADLRGLPRDEAVRYCDPKNPDDIADQIEFLLVHPEERVRLAECGWQRSQLFSWQRFVQDIFSTL